MAEYKCNFDSFTINFEPDCCAEASLDEQIRGVENDLIDERQEVADSEKRLADLKAAKARQDAEKAKTVGQKIAELEVRGDWDHADVFGMEVRSNTGRTVENLVALIRRGVADAIDKAIAPAKAEQREADALIARAERNRQYLSCGNPVCVAADIERHILEQK
jgi:hypothetical protein